MSTNGNLRRQLPLPVGAVGTPVTRRPTGSPEAVTRPRLPQNVACGFTALRSSGVGSQHRRALQRQWKRSLASLALLLALGQAPALAATGGCLAGSGADTLTLTNSSVHTLTSVNNTTFGPTGLPVVSSTITIEGHGSTIKRDSADPDQFRIFAINSGGNLTLNETTVSGGWRRGETFPLAAACTTAAAPRPSRTAPSRAIARASAAACTTAASRP